MTQTDSDRQGGFTRARLRPRFAPWRGGQDPVRMGLTPIEADEWLLDPAEFGDAGLAERRTEKQQLYAAHPTLVYGVADTADHAGPTPSPPAIAERSTDAAATRAAVDELAARLRAHVSARRAWVALPREIPPLVAAAFNVAEDLCVLLPTGQSDEDFRLVAASLSAPSYWRLAEKLGRPLFQVHQPVAGLEARIGARMRNFLNQLPDDRLFCRGNWHVHLAAERFHPEPDDWASTHNLTADNVGERLWMRCERQTLCKLPATGAVVFTILVLNARFDSYRDDLPLLADMWKAHQQMSPAAQAERHFSSFTAPLQGWLERLGAISN